MNTTSLSTIRNITGAKTTMSFAHFINPNNPDEVIVDFNNIALVVSKRAWNMVSLDAVVERAEDMADIRSQFTR